MPHKEGRRVKAQFHGQLLKFHLKGRQTISFAAFASGMGELENEALPYPTATRAREKLGGNISTFAALRC